MTTPLPQFQSIPSSHPSTWRTCWSLSYTKDFEMTQTLIVLFMPLIKSNDYHGVFGYNLWAPVTLIACQQANTYSRPMLVSKLSHTVLQIFVRHPYKPCKYQNGSSDAQASKASTIMSLAAISLSTHFSIYLFIDLSGYEIAQCHVTRMYYNCRCTLCIFESHFPSFWECFPHSMA